MTEKLEAYSKSVGKNKRNTCTLFPCPLLLTLVICKFVRYATWLSVGLTARQAGNATNNPGGEWALISAPEDFVLVGLKSSTRHFGLSPYHSTSNNLIRKSLDST